MSNTAAYLGKTAALLIKEARFSKVQTGVIGGGLGSLAGGLAGYLSAPEEDEETGEKPSPLRSILAGAGIGGALGAGAGAFGPDLLRDALKEDEYVHSYEDPGFELDGFDWREGLQNEGSAYDPPQLYDL